MSSIDETLAKIESAPDVNARVALIHKIPEEFGRAAHQDIYARVAERVYVPNLAPDIAFVRWREDYELPAVQSAYDLAVSTTSGFTKVDRDTLAAAIESNSTTLRVFRLLLGFTPQEFAAATEVVAKRDGVGPLSAQRVKSAESGGRLGADAARVCAVTIDDAMGRRLFPPPVAPLRDKTDKPDTELGWQSVREYATHGVPFPVYLHQRHYGGAFRQLLDATSTQRGDVIEDAVETLMEEHGISFVRTGSANQAQIAQKFGITVKPAPDFVFYDGADRVVAMLECKGANDGGTARDKARTIQTISEEAARHGVPLFAVLAGLGWARVRDTLGPVVRDTDGRVFTPATLPSILSVHPFPDLIRRGGST